MSNRAQKFVALYRQFIKIIAGYNIHVLKLCAYTQVIVSNIVSRRKLASYLPTNAAWTKIYNKVVTSQSTVPPPSIYQYKWH